MTNRAILTAHVLVKLLFTAVTLAMMVLAGWPLCSVVETPSQSFLPASGGNVSFSVDVTPDDCHWNVSSAASGAEITSRTLDNIGDGTVTFTVTPPFPTPGFINVSPTPSTSPGFSYTIWK